MFAKKVKHKIQYLVHVESIEQIPSAFVSNGGIKLAYAKGKQVAHKGETNIVPCTSQNMVLEEQLKFKTKLNKDEKTGAFEPKVVVFKLKHVATDGHKEKTLGTADIDLALLSTTPKSETRLAVQFAAKNQGKLKTKATLRIECLWLKVGDKRYNHASESTAIPPPTSIEHEEDPFLSANIMITTPFFDDDATISEMSSTSSDVTDDMDDSTVLIESADLENENYSKSASRITSDPSLSRVTNRGMVSSNSSTTLSGTSSSHLATITEEPNSKSTQPSRATSGAPVTEEALRPTKTMRMKKQASHSEIKHNVGEPVRAGSASLGGDPASRAAVQTNYIYSASTSALPEFHVEPSVSRHSTHLMTGTAPTRHRGKSTTGSTSVLPALTAPKPVSVNMNGMPVNGALVSATPPLPGAAPNAQLTTGNQTAGSSLSIGSMASSTSASSLNTIPHSMNSQSKAASGNGVPNGHMTHPQAQIRHPIEASPYVSYVDLDAPELPESAQSSVVYLAPNSFAIQNAAVSGDEVARLRAEKVDSNLKLGLLSKQVISLERRLSDAVRQAAEANKREVAKNAEIHNLEKKLRRLRKKTKLLDSTLDESSTTSSGGPTDPNRPTTGERKRKRKRVKDSSAASSDPNGSSSNLTSTDASNDVRIPRSRLCWTPEEERLGILVFISIAMLFLLFLCSTQFRLSLCSALEQLGILSPSIVTAATTEPIIPDSVAAASNELSEAFATAFNLSHPSQTVANNT